MYETKRLILREWQAGDLEPFVAMNQDPNVMQYFPSTYSREQSMQQIANYQTALQKYCYTMFACELKTTKEFIGFVGLMRRESGYPFAPCTEIGWRIAYEFWNNGYATEAAFKCLDLGFKNFNLDKIVSFTPTINAKSKHVMQKIGMKSVENGNFLHPKLDPKHELALHVLYQVTVDEYLRK